VLFSNVDVRQLHAIIVLAEELNFTRAAKRLHICQPALTKRVNEIEQHNKLRLFVRDHKRIVMLTDAGRVFVDEARCALRHTEQAISLARAAHDGAHAVLKIGHSPYADPVWVSSLVSTRMTQHPQTKLQFWSDFSFELAETVAAGDLDMALVTEPPHDPRVTRIPFYRAPLIAVLPAKHAASKKRDLLLRDLAEDSWIIYGERVHPLVHASIMEAARWEGIFPKDIHSIVSTRQAFQLVSEGLGVAILKRPPAETSGGLVIKPIADEALYLDTCVVMRKDHESKALSAFARSFLQKHRPLLSKPKKDLPRTLRIGECA